MKVPSQMPVMTLPGATLFPQAILPLFIYEPRYRRMLADALAGDRMFAVAMQKPGSKTERPVSVAGLGLIRASVEHKDGTSHLLLQGLARIELGRAVKYKPYRVHRLQVIVPPPANEAVTAPLVLQVRDLLAQRFKLGLPFPFPIFSAPDAAMTKESPGLPAKEILSYLDTLTTPDQVADLVTCAVLAGPEERQRILETPDVATRLTQLVKYLHADIRRRSQKRKDEDED